MNTSPIQLSRKKGWKMPPGARSVAYPTRWANPYRPAVRSAATNATAVARYRVHLAERLAADPTFLEPLRQATGLACWCPYRLPCHVDVLIEVLEGSPGDCIRCALSRGVPPTELGQGCRLENQPHDWRLLAAAPSERRSRHRRGEAKREGPVAAEAQLHRIERTTEDNP